MEIIQQAEFCVCLYENTASASQKSLHQYPLSHKAMIYVSIKLVYVLFFRVIKAQLQFIARDSK